MNILFEIAERKKKEVKLQRRVRSVRELEQTLYFKRECFSLVNRFQNHEIICEYKRKSPSKGIINSHSALEEVVSGYYHAGAAAVSVLTDEHYFGGSLDDLKKARNVLPIPILRKDFIVEEYQVLEAKANGADVILLIAAILEKKEIEHLAALAVSLGMEVLFEIHEEEEISKICEDIHMVGVNNRNLKNFEVSLDISRHLATKIPSTCIKISESGISKPETIRELIQMGYSGFLIGESFMKEKDPVEAARKFLATLKTNKLK